jgi:hypothetical protein
MPGRPVGLIALAIFGCGLGAGFAHATDFHAGPQDYREYLPRLVAGDRLLLRAGDYSRGLPLQGLNGEPGRPIIIAGPATEPRARFIARSGANTVSLVDVRHVSVRNLELDGRNLPVDAVKAEGHARYAHFVTLENLYIHDHAASQQNVGISSKCPAFGWVLRGNRIERVGTGMYLGNSDGSAPFVAGLIEHNRISDTLGYNLQIKHQKPRPADLPEAESQHDTIIRHNVFSKADAGPPSALARPNVLVGHMPLAGPGMSDRTLIYANLFWQNPSEALFQGEGNLAIYNNLFVNAQGHAVHIQPHNDVPRQVDIFHNTVLASGHGIRILRREGMAPAWPQRVLRNLVFAAQPIDGGERSDNLTGTFDAAARFLKKPFAEFDQLDLGPRTPLDGEITPAALGLAAYPDSGEDTNGRTRTTLALGACAYDRKATCPKFRHDH